MSEELIEGLRAQIEGLKGQVEGLKGQLEVYKDMEARMPPQVMRRFKSLPTPFLSDQKESIKTE